MIQYFNCSLKFKLGPVYKLIKYMLFGLFNIILLANIAIAKDLKLINGVDYKLLLVPVAATNASNARVDVKEFFSFNCFHCKLLESLVQKNIATNKLINLDKIQATWGDDSTIMAFARLNATLQNLHLDKLYLPIFNAVASGDNFADHEVLVKLLKNNSLTEVQIKQFMDVYKSFAIDSKVTQYKQLTSDYNVTMTPLFIIANKYVVIPATPERTVDVVLALVKTAQLEQKH